jgi:hypothetical protein
MDLVPVRSFSFGFFGAALVTAAGVVAVVALVLGVPVGARIDERIEAGRPAAVYVSEPGTMLWVAGDAPVGPVPCEPSGVDGVTWSTTVIHDDIRVTAHDRQWRAVQLMTADPAGRYTVTCAGGGEFAAGEPPLIHGPVTWAAAVAGASMVAVGGLVASLVFALRRRSEARSGAGGRTLAD